MEYVGYAASFLMGIILGLTGGGGSILTVPILVYLFGVAPTIATGYSLFVVGVTALIGTGLYIRKKDINFTVGLSFAAASAVGVIGARSLILPNIPDTIVQVNGFVFTKEILIMAIFAILMIATSYSMLKKRTASEPKQTASPLRFAVIAAQGFIVGIIAGIVGAGGGFLIIPALVVFAGLSMRVAIGTSLMIIAIQSLLGFGADIVRGHPINWALISVIATMAVIGVLAGSTVAHKIKEQHLKITFGWFILLMGIVILTEQMSRLSS